ncbi:MAG: WYL domain-containing protein [Lachnospiraceae bacterium]|nr:WYL domain-containing protein [Lachnospiraceae bacterium]
MAKHTTENKTDRILILYQRLCNGEVINKAEFAASFQVNVRSVQRDIDDLRAYFANQSAASGICPAILYDRNKKGYYLDYGSQKMSGSELLAVCKILLESRALTKSELNPIIQKLLYNCSPPADRKQVEELIANEQFHYIEPHHHTEFVSNLWEIGAAVKDQKYLEIQYAKMGSSQPVKRKIKPVGIMFSEYYFYLIAYIAPKPEGQTKEYAYPAIYRIDRIRSYRVLEEHFKVPYADRFEEGEFRKRVQFMYGGKLQRIVFEYTGISVEAILDRLPTAVVLEQKDGTYIIRAEVFGDGIDMWIRSQGEALKVLSRKEI